MKKLSIIFGLFILLVSGQILAKDPLKVGFIYVSPIGDAGWTYQHDQGRIAIEEEFGDQIQVKYIESVGEGPDAERVIRKLASSGYDLIFGTSFGYMNPMLKIAKAFPKVVFEHATGYKTSRNMGNYTPRFYEGRYLAGIAAGSKVKSNFIGYIAAFPIPEVVRGINAFALGAQSVNPKAKVKVIWTNSWFNPGKESEAANTLLAQGADLLTHHTDSVAVVKAAQDKGKYAIAYHSDMKKHGGEAQLGAVIHLWHDFYSSKVRDVLDGNWEASSLWYGISKDMVDFQITSDLLDDDIIDKIEQTKEGIPDGTIHPFTGPIIDQRGKLRVAEGEVLTDQDMLSMNYFVRGVIGRLSN